MASSAYTFSLEPKPPPTSGAITRSLFSSMPQVPESVTFAMCGICVELHSVDSPVEGMLMARQPRGSIALGISRGCS